MSRPPLYAVAAAALLVVALPFAAFLALKLIVLVGDDSGDRMLRAEAPAAIVDGALLQHAKTVGDPALIARDFTQIRYDPHGRLDGGSYLPCPLSAAELEASLRSLTGGASCRFGPAPVSTLYDSRCPEKTCVLVPISPETWTDAGARAAVEAAFRDPATRCAYARDFGVNHVNDAYALGCFKGRGKPPSVQLVVTPRVPNPCRTIPVGDNAGYRSMCRARELARLRVG